VLGIRSSVISVNIRQDCKNTLAYVGSPTATKKPTFDGNDPKLSFKTFRKQTDEITSL
jgi:hypothetical protein